MSTGASGRGVMVRQRQRVRAEGVAASSVRMLEPGGKACRSNQASASDMRDFFLLVRLPVKPSSVRAAAALVRR